MRPVKHNKRMLTKNMKIYIIFILLTILNVLACSEPIETIKEMPVMVGGEVEFDACGSAAELTFFEKEKVKIFSAPDEKSNIRDLVSKKILVSVCDSSNGWFGIVYSTDENVRCGTGSPIKIRQAYAGPCKSGWVKESNLGGWIG